MSEIDESPKHTGVRFPFINLEKALGRAKELYDADQRGREMTIGGAFGVWEYSEKSSGGFQTVGALKMYGILKDSGTGDSRKLALTESALRYFRDEREDEKKKLAAEFALKPKLIAALWDEWHSTPPADAIARSHLKAERGLNEQAARTLLAIYKDNLAFAEIKTDAKIERNIEQNENDKPMEPVVIQPQSSGGARRLLDMPASAIKPPAATAPMLQEVFNLDEGPVTLAFPSNLSQESYEELEAAIQLFLRRMKRRSLWSDPEYRARREAAVIQRANQVADEGEDDAN